MAYYTANTYETIELFGLTEKDAQLPIPEDHILTDHSSPEPEHTTRDPNPDFVQMSNAARVRLAAA